MLRILTRAVRRALAEGASVIHRYIVICISDKWNDWCLGVSTSGIVDLSAQGVHGPFRGRYAATDYRSFRRIMRHFHIRRGKDVFLDYGSGKGRVVLMAAEYPFRRIIGIEIAPSLTSIARENIRCALPHLVCKDIELVTADAALFPVPSDVTFIYGYGTFRGQALEQALNNIWQSLLASPRPLTILWKNATFFEAEASRHKWLAKQGERPCPAGHTYVIYTATAGRP